MFALRALYGDFVEMIVEILCFQCAAIMKKATSFCGGRFTRRGRMLGLSLNDRNEFIAVWVAYMSAHITEFIR